MTEFVIVEDDFQQDFSMTINGYPFLKKMTQHPVIEFTYVFPILKHFDDMAFILNVRDGTITPHGIITNNSDFSQPSESAIDNQRRLRALYEKHKRVVQSYISHQLINSGVLDSLADVPVRKCQVKQYNNRDNNGNFKDHWSPSPTFGSNIVILLNTLDKSIGFTGFHQDHNIFNIIQYHRTGKPHVLGSELLFYHATDDTRIHPKIDKKTDSYPVGTVGRLIHNAYESAKIIYHDYMADEFNYPHSILRSKLRNGDTIMFSDILWKHAVINPDEQITKVERSNTSPSYEFKRMQTHYSKVKFYKNVEDYLEVDALVCSKRLPTTMDEHNKRQLIKLSIEINDRVYFNPKYNFEPFPIDADLIPVSSINLTEESCVIFLKYLGIGNTCVSLNQRKVLVKPRGGSLSRPRGGSLSKPSGGSLSKPSGGSLSRPRGGSLSRKKTMKR